MYHNFVGIDIGKFEIVVAVHGIRSVNKYKNEESDLKRLYQEYKKYLKNGLIVLETTGGYEKPVLEFLLSKKIAVHRANTRIVKNFIRSIGKFGKSDKIDALCLARYGKERYENLPLYEAVPDTCVELVQINNRINELKQDLVREKNRLQAPDNKFIKPDIVAHAEHLNTMIKKLQSRLDVLIGTDQDLQDKLKQLEEIAGIGKTIAINLMLAVPELGHINNKAVASSTGVAPHPNESGNTVRYRRTIGGRRFIRPMLFIAAMSASRSHSPLGEFYRALIARGKKPMVALVALARKIVVLANVKIRDLKYKKIVHHSTEDLSLQTQIKPA